MNALRLLAATLVAMVAMHTAPARAAGYQEVFKGVANGYDTLGIFGAAGAQFLNTPFELVFSIDTTRGRMTTNGLNQTVKGGTEYGTSDPVTATLKIGSGHAVVFGSTGYMGIAETGVFTTSSGQAYGKVSAEVVDVKGGLTYDLSASIVNYLSAAGFPTRFGQSFSAQAGTNYSTDGDFSIRNSAGKLLECVSLNPLTATAPEPGAWVLMLGGVGLMGLALRGRRRREGLAAA